MKDSLFDWWTISWVALTNFLPRRWLWKTPPSMVHLSTANSWQRTHQWTWSPGTMLRLVFLKANSGISPWNQMHLSVNMNFINSEPILNYCRYFVSVWSIRSQWCVRHVWTTMARHRSLRLCWPSVESWSTPGLKTAPIWSCPLLKSPSRSGPDTVSSFSTCDVFVCPWNMCWCAPCLFFFPLIRLFVLCCAVVPSWSLSSSQSSAKPLSKSYPLLKLRGTIQSILVYT